MSQPACIRTGMCCENVLLSFSPRQLRESFRAWRDSKSTTEGIIQLAEIWLVYPMLEGKCKGKLVRTGGYVRYVYGPCKNLKYTEENGKTIAACSIHPDRPRLCSGYPSYDESKEIQMHVEDPPSNKGYMRGCGYNSDKTKGLDPDQLNSSGLVALEEAEK